MLVNVGPDQRQRVAEDALVENLLEISVFVKVGSLTHFDVERDDSPTHDVAQAEALLLR